MKTEVRKKLMISHTVRGMLAVLGMLLLLAFIALLLFPISYRVDVTLEGIGWQLGSPSVEEPVTIQIKGIYRQYLLDDDVFEGDIHIQDIGYTDDAAWRLPPVTLKDGYGELTWFSQEQALESRHYGFIIADMGMNRVIIGRQGTGESFGKTGSYLITAPAENHNDAVAKTGALLKKHFGWLQKLDISGEYV